MAMLRMTGTTEDTDALRESAKKALKKAKSGLTDKQRDALRKKQHDALADYRLRRRDRVAKAARAAFGKKAEDMTEEQLKELEDLINRAARFNIHYHCVTLMQGDTFFCRISQRVLKQASLRIPTAAICYSGGEFTLLYNPFFMASLDADEVKFVLKHEFYHLILEHLTTRRRKLMRLWNITTDLAINWLIQEGGGKPPDRVLLPGVRPKPPPAGMRMSPEEKDANEKMAAKIESLPPAKSSEWYYEDIKAFCLKEGIPLEPQPCKACAAGVPRAGEEANELGKKDEDGDDKKPGDGEQKAKGKGDEESDEQDSGDQDGDQEGDGHQHGQGECPGGDQEGDGHGHGEGDDTPQHTCGGIAGIGPLDDHDWEEVPAEEREYAQARARKIVGDAVRDASQSNNWGTVPAHMQAYLRQRYSNQVAWEKLLRNFTGRARGTTRTSSIKVINRRYPYIHPGVKRGYTANLWIFIDMSGSVDDRSLELLFGELGNLTRKMSIKVFPFDSAVDEADSFIWRRGTKIPPRRVRCGGTSFQAVVDHINSHKGECDGALIMSDGECSKPTPAPCKFGYIIVPGRKINFEPRPSEMHIQMTDNNKAEMGGTW